ncbi:MAG TPA: mechanosensitive ion channel domain-containing protein [Candidatus Limnocylindrales bacterium]|jgi:small-conductance mechanosensitive channel|nr:mechanosensitive ion channel domain-containing protein [Candidatus Limnocylindrales bacterium]
MPFSRILHFALLSAALAVHGRGAQPEQSAPLSNAQATVTAVQAIDERLAEARKNLASTEALGDAALTNVPSGVSLQDIATRRALVSRVVRLFEQQLSNVTELETARNRRAELARKAQAWTRFAEPPPYSILLPDRLREEIQTEQLKSAGGEAAVSTIDQLISDNRNELTHTEERIRQVNEQLEGTKDSAGEARLLWQRDLEKLRSQVAAASLGVLDSERQLRQEALEESRVRIGWLQRQLVVADAGARFTEADLDKVTARIESARLLLEREFTETQARLTNTLQGVEAAREELARTQSRHEASPGANARAAEALTTREAQLQTVQESLRILRFILESENVERAMWELRFAAYDSRSVETLSDSERRHKSFTRRLTLWKDYQQQQMEVSPSQIELQETRIKTLAADSDLLPLARERLAALREHDQLLQRLVRRIDHVQRLSQRWAEGVRVAEGRLPFLGRLRNMLSDAGSFAQKLWAFELFTAEDTITVEGQRITGKRSITLGKIILAILILGLGIWLTGLVSRVAEPIIIRRLKIEANQANLIRRWLRAFMVVCLVMFSLVSVKIPLTAFAFAGGALAIGLGFGMQTLLKNFVSGLILLFERPFRVGDVLDVGGDRGTVTEIGLRASVLQLWDGTETLIPNSSLLENKVSNWTYSSRKVRFTVTVGTAYGSDTRRVIQLLSEMAERHGVVEKEPKPQVFFTEFGESALTFELRYWVDVIKANAAQVGSDLRQMIASALAENGIVIAFPRRDLHIDMARPLAVQIVTGPQVINHEPPA